MSINFTKEPEFYDPLAQAHSDNKNAPGLVPKIRTCIESLPDPKSRSSAPVFSEKVSLPPLTSYSLESLQASLKQNEAVLNNSRAFKSLPDNGKKLIESNDLIREAIQIKLQEKVKTRRRTTFSGKSHPNLNMARSPDPKTAPKRRSPLSKETSIGHRPRTKGLESQFNSLSLSSNSLASSSGASSSGRQSLSSIYTDKRTSSGDFTGHYSNRTSLLREPKFIDIPPPKMDPLLRSLSIEFRGRDMPLKVAIKLREEEERIHRENAMRYHIQQTRMHSKSHTHPPPASRYTPFFDFAEDDSDDFDGFSEDEYY